MGIFIKEELGKKGLRRNLNKEKGNLKVPKMHGNNEWGWYRLR